MGWNVRVDTSANGVHRQMKCEQSKDMRTKRMKCVLYIAAGLGIREGTENLVDPQKESGEDYARRILEVLKKVRGEKLRNKEDEESETKGNGSTRVLHPARGEDETKTYEKGEEGEQTKLNPQNEIMVKHINGFSDKKQRKKVKGKEETRQEPRRPVLDREEKIDFYPKWKLQQGVREEKEEGERRQERM